MGAEANHAAGFVKGVAHGEVFAAVGVVPPFRYRRTVYDKIIYRRAVGVGLSGAQTVGVVLILGGFRAGFCGCQLPTVAPGKRPVTAIEIGQGVANLVVGKRAGGGLAVVGHRETSQQILPLAVPIGIGVPIPQIVKRRVGIFAADVTIGVVGEITKLLLVGITHMPDSSN